MKAILEGLIMLAAVVIVLHLIYTMWRVRNADALRRMESQPKSVGGYHGITRHDPDWEV